MRRSYCFRFSYLVFLLLIFLPLASAEDASSVETTQELTNPSFEVAQGPAFEWITKNLTIKDTQNCNKAYEGRCSFTVRGGRKTKSLRQELLIAGKAGDIFTLSGRAKVKRGRTKACSAKVVLHYETGTSRKKTLRFSVKSRKWQYRQKRITAAYNFEKVSVVILCPKRAAVTTLDDFKLSSKLGDISLLTPYVLESDIPSIYQAYTSETGAAASPWGFTHQGIDFSTTTDLVPFQAVAAGYVSSISLYHSEGTDKWHVNVIIRHNSAYETIYAFEPFTSSQQDAQDQKDSLFIEEGEYIDQGETLGYLLYGEAGTHVHFSLLKNKEWMCPETYFTTEALQSVYKILRNTLGANTKLCYE